MTMHTHDKNTTDDDTAPLTAALDTKPAPTPGSSSFLTSLLSLKQSVVSTLSSYGSNTAASISTDEHTAIASNLPASSQDERSTNPASSESAHALLSTPTTTTTTASIERAAQLFSAQVRGSRSRGAWLSHSGGGGDDDDDDFAVNTVVHSMSDWDE